jgi:hypothetical protein
MINNIRKFLFPAFVFLLFISQGIAQSSNASSQQKPVVIDERDSKLKIQKIIEIDTVWSGHPVGFSLFTDNDRQYIAYYNAKRHIVVGQRNLDQDNFTLHKIPPKHRKSREGTSTILGWDSHNYLTIGIDKEGYIHLSGNMHVNGLTYFRSTRPADITTLVQVNEMIGSNEKRCTYPKFMNDLNGELIFHYRDGGSGNGNEIYNIYSCKEQQWSRLLDVPLTDGQGQMNAYASQPKLGPDNWYHMYWVWRDTPDCSTNHDLSYIKSPDLQNWYNAFGQPVELPVTIDNKSVIVDPIPVKGGIINLAAKLCLDDDNKPIMAYHKYDLSGNLQFYVARTIGDQWVSKKITSWDYRWEFSGNGSINSEVRLGNFSKRSDGSYELGYTHIKYGSGTLLLDQDLDLIGEVLKPETLAASIQTEGNFPGLEIRTAADLGKSREFGVQYMLKWETLARNRDRPRAKPWPKPARLYLYELHK